MRYNQRTLEEIHHEKLQHTITTSNKLSALNRENKMLPQPLISVLLLVALRITLHQSISAEAAARLINVPLRAETTPGAGEKGQPVISYYALVNVGTPKKPFNVQFDVATNELILPHYSWVPFNNRMHFSRGFQCKKSTTCVKYNSEIGIDYMHVGLSGKRYEDFVGLDGVMSSLDDRMGLKPVSWRQNFLAISKATTGRFSSLPVDGFFGLGPSCQSTNGVASILMNLHRSNLIDNLQFSFWFNPVLDNPNGGALILGGVDTNRHQGQLYWHHLEPQASAWSLGLQRVMVNNQTVGCRAGCRALFSTGTSDLYAPRNDAMQIYALLGATSTSTGLYLIDCRRIPGLPYLTFYIDGVPYNLPPSNYVRKTTDSSTFGKTTCYVAIMPSDDDASTWTLSTPFLGAFYSVFDLTYRQLGFAALK